MTSMRRIFTLVGVSVGATLAGATMAVAPAVASVTPATQTGSAWTTAQAGSAWTQAQKGSAWTQAQKGSAWTQAQQGSAWTAPEEQSASALQASGHLLVDSGRNLTRVTALGTDAKTLVAGKAAQRKYGTYSTDGARIAFSDLAKSGGFGAQLWTMKADGTDRRQLTKLGDQANCANISRDGKSVAFQVLTGGVGAVWIVGVDGRNPHQVTKPGAYYGCPSLAPGGGSFVAARANVDERSGEPYGWEIYSVRADGKGEKRLTTTGGDKNSPVYSPNGSTIVYSYISAQGMQSGSEYDLWSIKAAGGAARQLTATKNVSEQAAVFSPAGTQLVYAHWATGTTAPTVWRSAADGSAPVATAASGYPTSWM
jgi:Tol biopolymer transport system component